MQISRIRERRFKTFIFKNYFGSMQNMRQNPNFVENIGFLVQLYEDGTFFMTVEVQWTLLDDLVCVRVTHVSERIRTYSTARYGLQMGGNWW